MTTGKVGIDDVVADGAGRAEVEGLPRVAFTPMLANEALHGLAGRIVRAIEPYSEADPAAILAHVLVGVGNLVGLGPYALVEKTTHRVNEFAVLVGATSKARKGQAWSVPRSILEQVDERWVLSHIRTGMSSGEGLIYHVRDAREERQPVKERRGVVSYESIIVDEGEADKRLLVIEPEFASVLRRMQAESNSLSAVLRQAWDDGNLSTLTRNAPLRATGAHISVVAHITREELIASLTETERANGFANRFLFFLCQRSKCLPEGATVPDDQLRPLVEALRRVVDFAREAQEVKRDSVARDVWAVVYPKLSQGEPGLLGAVLARAEAHVLRLSVIYALLDCSPVVRPVHLKAAIGLWDFAAASARRIFGDRLGLSVPDTILAALRRRGPLTRTDIVDLFHRNKPAAEIDVALRLLEEAGKVRRATRPREGGAGRPAEVWEALA